MNTYAYTREDLEDFADKVKACTIKAFEKSKKADDWCAAYTIILRKKTVFNTISDLFKKEKQSEDGHYIIVVKKVN
jgi:hypothetical protein